MLLNSLHAWTKLLFCNHSSKLNEHFLQCLRNVNLFMNRGEVITNSLFANQQKRGKNEACKRSWIFEKEVILNSGVLLKNNTLVNHNCFFFRSLSRWSIRAVRKSVGFFYDLIIVQRQRFLNGSNQSLSFKMRMQMRICSCRAKVN